MVANFRFLANFRVLTLIRKIIAFLISQGNRKGFPLWSISHAVGISHLLLNKTLVIFLHLSGFVATLQQTVATASEPSRPTLDKNPGLRSVDSVERLIESHMISKKPLSTNQNRAAPPQLNQEPILGFRDEPLSQSTPVPKTPKFPVEPTYSTVTHGKFAEYAQMCVGQTASLEIDFIWCIFLEIFFSTQFCSFCENVHLFFSL